MSNTVGHVSSSPNNQLLLQPIGTNTRVCTKHDSQYEVVCLYDYKKLCRKCTKGQHKNHTLKRVAEIKAEAANKIKSLKQLKNEMKQEQTQKNELTKLLEGNKIQLWNENKRGIEMVKNQVRYTEEEILAEIGIAYTHKKRKLWSDTNSYEIHQLQNTIAVLSDTTNIDDTFLDAYNDTEIENVHNDFDVKDVARLVIISQSDLTVALNNLHGSITADLYNFEPLFFHSNDQRATEDQHSSKHLNVAGIITLVMDVDKLIISPAQEAQQPALSYQDITKVNLQFDEERLDENKVQAICHIWHQLGPVSDVELNLSNNGFDDMDLLVFNLYRFWHTSDMQGLAISLSNTKVLDGSVKKLFMQTLAKMPKLQRLHLNLDYVGITDTSLLTFARHVVPKLQQLQDLRLDLLGTQITPNGISELFRAIGIHMKRLQAIKLSLGTSIDDACLLALAQHLLPSLGQLDFFELSLSGSHVFDEGVAQFYETVSKTLRNVKAFALALHETSVTDKSLDTFVEKVLPRMEKLERLCLDLSGTLITGAGVNWFLKRIPKQIRKTKTLKLNFNGCIAITEGAVGQIKSTVMATLSEVEILEIRLPNLLVDNMSLLKQ